MEVKKSKCRDVACNVSAVETLLRHFCLVDQQNRDSIAYRIDAMAAGALHGAFICRQGQRLAALRRRTNKDVEQLLQDHETILSSDFSVR